jgi:hypothetical protein
MALGSNQTLTNEYQEYHLGAKGDRCVGLATLTTSCADCLELLGASISRNTQGLSSPVHRLLYLSLSKLFFTFICSVSSTHASFQKFSNIYLKFVMCHSAPCNSSGMNGA